MSISYGNFKSYNRSKGNNAVAASAYRMRAKLEHNGKTYDYTRHKEKSFFNYSCSKTRDDYSVKEIQDLWSRVEELENRKNSNLFHEWKFALPNELSDEGKISVTKNISKYFAEEHNIFVCASIHKASTPSTDSNGNTLLDTENNPIFNHHVHIQISDRTFDDKGELKNKWREIAVMPTNKIIVENHRNKWEKLINQRLGYEQKNKAKINMKSYKRQGVDKQTQTHIGKKLNNAKDQNGIALKNDRMRKNDNIRAYNKNSDRNKLSSKNTDSILSKQIKAAEGYISQAKAKTITTYNNNNGIAFDFGKRTFYSTTFDKCKEFGGNEIKGIPPKSKAIKTRAINNKNYSDIMAEYQQSITQGLIDVEKERQNGAEQILRSKYKK